MQEPKKMATNNMIWSLGPYNRFYQQSIEEPEKFWADQAIEMSWFKPWEKVLEWNEPYARWFTGGKLNACYNCVDRHMNTPTRNKVAYYWEGEDGQQIAISYSMLYEKVNEFAGVLKKLGVGKGDRVTIYMPMVPEMIYAMLACARIGAIHCAIFSGFSSQAIVERVNDSKSKVLITCDGCYRRAKLIELKNTVDIAAPDCLTLEHVLVCKYIGNDVVRREKDVYYDEIVGECEKIVEPEPMDSCDPLFILYTSGTSGTPKGIIHSTAGYLLYAAKTMQWAFDLQDDSVYWCTADIGWITGHSYALYAPLFNGVTSVIYDGAPDYPSIERWWQIIDRYGVSIFYTSPTAVRMFMGKGEEFPAKYSLKTIRTMGSVGEAINPETWSWLYRVIGHENCPIIDTWWQTESGGFLIAPCSGVQSYPLKPGSATFPMPGIDPIIVDGDGTEVPAGEKGLVLIRKPWPGMLMDVYGNTEGYKKTYWSRFPGNYLPGDYAMKDNDGYWWLLGRADEVIKVSGHRISTAELEHVVVSHPAVAECGASSKPHPVKGDAIVLFIILRDGHEPSDILRKELVKYLRTSIGPVATPEEIIFVNSLPKTRSGKIMRRILKAVASGEEIGNTVAIEDGASIEETVNAFNELKKQSQG